MFKPSPSEKELSEMEAAGLTPEDFGGGDVEVWPENGQTFFLFEYMQTQWRAGGMGLIGMDYDTLHHKMDRMKLDAEEYERLEGEVRMMEFTAIAAMNGRGIDPDQ